MQGLLRRAERLVQGETVGAGNTFVVPGDDELDRNRDAGGDPGRRRAAAEPQHGGADPWLGGHERDAEATAQRDTPVADRAATDVLELLDGVHDRLPFGHGVLGGQQLESSEQRCHVGAGIDAGLVLAGDPVQYGMEWPVPVARDVHAHDRGTQAGDEPVSAVQDGGCLLVLAAAVTDDDQRAGAGGAGRGPQDTGNLTEGEKLLADAVRRAGGVNVHRRASPFGMPGRALPGPCEAGSPDRLQR
ncbi:hypothetical protein AB0G04_10940 [Actinoplanes sp. NPDC023801]|uniref:hypothetical protein n=1 Tax=Actinoplanes sp. NPDC023801 TaxID=3154595 RepID=UPI0033E4F0C1